MENKIDNQEEKKVGFEKAAYLLIEEWMQRGLDFQEIRTIINNNISPSMLSTTHLDRAIRFAKEDTLKWH